MENIDYSKQWVYITYPLKIHDNENTKIIWENIIDTLNEKIKNVDKEDTITIEGTLNYEPSVIKLYDLEFLINNLFLNGEIYELNVEYEETDKNITVDKAYIHGKLVTKERITTTAFKITLKNIYLEKINSKKPFVLYKIANKGAYDEIFEYANKNIIECNINGCENDGTPIIFNLYNKCNPEFIDDDFHIESLENQAASYPGIVVYEEKDKHSNRKHAKVVITQDNNTLKKIESTGFIEKIKGIFN